MNTPLIAVSGCALEDENGRVNFKASEKYCEAVAEVAGAMPVIVPPMAELIDVDDLLSRVDGVFLTGSPSNVSPEFYDGPAFPPETARDLRRDRMTLAMIRRAVERGIPLFAVCRGIQEMNVAFGGTLHQNVHDLPDKRDHRMDRTVDYDTRYANVHAVDIKPGGVLEKLAGQAGPVMVNSLHAQAIDRVAPGLFVEAVSDDGVIEAVSVVNAKNFAVGVQWHPEHRVARVQPLNKALFESFGAAARNHLSGAGSTRSAHHAA